MLERLGERAIKSKLLERDIKIGDDRPWDIQVNNKKFYSRILWADSLGMGEAYVDQFWDCRRVDLLFDRLLRGNESGYLSPYRWVFNFWARFLNKQTPGRALSKTALLYDIGYDFYEVLLGSSRVFTCGYWKNASDLNEAQTAKLKLLFSKAGLQPGMKVLDIGCGWGGLAEYAAKHYGAQVTGVTISKSQQSIAAKHCEGLPVDIQLLDYRSLSGQFDRIFCVGMFEHVGFRQHRTFMKTVQHCLKPDGIFVLQTMCNNETTFATDPWLNKYIFPYGQSPSLQQIISSMESIFVVEDVHNFGPDYHKTLMAWHENLQKGWPELSKKYDLKFKRMWDYFLQMAAGVYLARASQLYHLVLTHPGRVQPPNLRLS